MWTKDKEAEYNALEKKVNELYKERAEAVSAVRDALNDAGLAYHVMQELDDYLISHADSIRDALAPFDSGVRAAKPLAGDNTL